MRPFTQVPLHSCVPHVLYAASIVICINASFQKALDEEVRGLAEELINQYNATKDAHMRDGMMDPSSGEQISITVRSHTFVVTHPIARYGFRPQRKTTSARI